MTEDIQNGILEVSVDKYTKTIELMDQFEFDSLPNAKGHYSQMVLRNFYKFGYRDGDLYMSPVIERFSCVKHAGSITFTKLKQEKHNELEQFIIKQITGEIIAEYVNKSEPYIFDSPYLLKAQNCCDLVEANDFFSLLISKPHHKYGETSQYSIVGVYIGYREPEFTSIIQSRL